MYSIVDQGLTAFSSPWLQWMFFFCYFRSVQHPPALFRCLGLLQCLLVVIFFFSVEHHLVKNRLGDRFAGRHSLAATGCMVPCTTRGNQAFQCFVAVVERPISGVIDSVGTVEICFFSLIFHDGVCSTSKEGIKINKMTQI